MAVTDWVSNLFQSEQTRGLSGGAAPAVALDNANPYYNYRLRRHRTDGDLITDPSLLWYTSQFVETRDGLGVHIAAEHAEGVAGFTDVLLILSIDDYNRISDSTGEPWLQRATRNLLQAFDDYCSREGFRRRFDHRQLGFRILCDGSADMGGRSLGLQSGEFVTGLLPNLYTGPVKGSYPVIGIHVNLPGVWDGYQEVGRLYNDQVLFTIGSSWLDNFTHPSLKEAALYRLRQDADSNFIHIVSPDLQDSYQLTATEQGDASVLTLATRGGEPLAYMVLALLEGPAAEPDIAPPMLIDGVVQEVKRTREGHLRHSKTIIPEAPSERIFTLQERGALLQRVHFRNFMQGYDVFLGTRGELGTQVEEKAATFQVRRREVTFIAHVNGVAIDGKPAVVGEPIEMDRDCAIDVLGERLEYRHLRGLKVEKWPYVGEIRRPASSNYMMWGQTYRVGRAIDARVVLPDNPNNANIHWKAEVSEGAYIRARTGDIEKSKFYTDSIMVASNHAEIDLASDTPAVSCTAKHCFVYVRRDGACFPLYPTATGKQPTDMAIEPGDELLIGNSVFHVGFTPSEAAVAPAPAPEAQLSADALVAAVSAPDFEESGLEDAPSLGGEPPPPVQLEPSGPDSILGDAPLRGETTPKRVDVVFDDLDEPAPPPKAAAVEWEEEDTWSQPAPKLATPPSFKSPLDAPTELEAKPPEPPPEPEPPPAPEPAAAAKPQTAQPAPAATPVGADSVVAFVDEEDAQFELGREVHLVHTGWMVAGELSCGNHGGCDMIIPENRIDSDQTFEAITYFNMKVRGRKSRLTVERASEFLFDEADVDSATYDDISEIPIDVIRRDDAGDEDFAVRLELYEDPSLPNPRARMLGIDTADKLAAALLTRGLPLNQPRALTFGALAFNAVTDGTNLTITDYLDTYRLPDGSFRPFFVQHGDDPFKTAPEDGSPIELAPEDRIIVDHAVYVVRDR